MCDINPKTPRDLSRPGPWPGFGDTESKTGEEREGREVSGRAGLGYVSDCFASDQSERAFFVAKPCRCTIINTLAADQCAQRSDGVAFPKCTRCRADATLCVEWRARSRELERWVTVG